MIQIIDECSIKFSTFHFRENHVMTRISWTRLVLETCFFTHNTRSVSYNFYSLSLPIPEKKGFIDPIKIPCFLLLRYGTLIGRYLINIFNKITIFLQIPNHSRKCLNVMHAWSNNLLYKIIFDIKRSYWPRHQKLTN